MTSTAASSSSVGDPAPPAPVAGAAGAAGGSYFADQKKGEVNELLTLLRACSADRDPKKKRDVLKKVIAYMTLGVDVSRLFSQMLMAIETRDLVVKKMVYLYLCTYASSNPDLAIMCINTLQRDCSNEDPMVRGLALRSLCSLRLPTVVEYIMDPLSRSLTDSNAYVRKTGVIGVVKLHDLAPERVKEANMVDTLYDMLGDVDQQVVTNCLFALQEIMGDEGGMAISQSIVLNLLSRIEMFNEWGLCQVLGIICRYAAADDDEIFTIMNLLDPVLRTSNSGVVLSTTKCFLHLTRDMPELHRQVYERLKAPLLTLMAGGTVEIMHCILLHVEVLVQRCPGVFDDEFRLFYTRDNDPSNVKYAKVKLLSYLVSESNMQDIVDELSEYVCDPDSEMARRAIRAIGFIAHRLPQSVPLAVSHISGFLDTDIDHVLAETILMVQRLLRKYPDWRGHTLGNLKKCIRTVEEPKARAAAIWMLGQYGDEIPDSPYVIEPIIDAYGEESSIEVKLSLLNATVRLFFKRPPEVQAMLGRLLTFALDDASSQDLHDRALFYVRLLREDVEAARDVIACPIPPISDEFAEEKDSAELDSLFSEFNTLSIMYGERSEQFTAPEYLTQPGLARVHVSKEERLAQELGDLGIAPLLPPANGGGVPRQPPQSVGAASPPRVNLLDMDDAGPSLLDDRPAAGHGSSLPVDGLAGDGPIQLRKGAQMEPKRYQELWSTLPEASNKIFSVSRAHVSSAADVEASLAALQVYTMASGDKADVMKFFFYAASGTHTHLLQCTVTKLSQSANLIIKTTADPPLGAQIADKLVDIVKSGL